MDTKGNIQERRWKGVANVSQILRNRNTPEFKKQTIEIEQERLRFVNMLVALRK